MTPEHVLLVRLRRGEPDAFETLVRTYQDRLYDFCVRMLSDREEAYDVVQDVFVSAHQHLARFREDAKLSTWLYRIAKNHCINRLKYLNRRGRGRSEEYGERNEEALAEALGSPPGPDAALESAREQARVQWAISRLEPDARMLVALRDIEGLAYEEIVDITELPLGTVKSRLHRAREKLAEWLERVEE
ncbi:sigma-70 family RNA polymerase sigma factor [Melittangium boletus]|uniref:sigma-70 family RNA polymerase sigma factor n=1 Tax=Melittangium boletus TaxID=83453 RepID=UPI003DA38701